MLNVASQRIQEIKGACFKYRNAVFNGVQENELVIFVRMGYENAFLAINDRQAS